MFDTDRHLMSSCVTNMPKTFLLKSDLKFRQCCVFLFKITLASLSKIPKVCRKHCETTLKIVSQMFKNPNKFPFKDSVNISIHFQGIIVKNIDGNEMHSFFKK